MKDLVSLDTCRWVQEHQQQFVAELQNHVGHASHSVGSFSVMMPPEFANFVEYLQMSVRKGGVVDRGMNKVELHRLISSDDQHFDNALANLSMKELLDVVTGLQQAMAVEQANFDKISVYLKSSRNNKDEQRMREAQRRSQDLLAKLCSRNMRCFTQQAVQAKQDHAHITSQTVVSRRKEVDKKQPTMTREDSGNKTVVKNGDGPDEGAANFRQRLAFFQNRTSVENERPKPDVDKKAPVTSSKNLVNGDTKRKKSGGDKMVPNVDDVLLSVKLLRQSQQDQQQQRRQRSDGSDDSSDKWEGEVAEPAQDWGVPEEEDVLRTVENDAESDDSSDQQRQFNHYERLFNAQQQSTDGTDHDYDDVPNNDDGDEDYFEEDEDFGYSNNRYVHQHHGYHGTVAEEVGLEVILEEDEESITCSAPSTSSHKDDEFDEQMMKYERSGQLNSNNAIAECDSGVTDDQRSNSTADDVDSLVGDTDSAKGSMVTVTPSPVNSIAGRIKELGFDVKPTTAQHVHKVHFDLPKSSIPDEVDRIFESCEAEVLNAAPAPASVPNHHTYKINGVRESNYDQMPSNEFDPTKLLKKLYSTKFPEVKHAKSDSSEYINIEGYLEKLPSGRKKATFWNPWKKRFFRAQDGYLYYYESNQGERETLSLQLMGGNIDTLDNNLIGVDDGKGHYMVMKCSSKEEANRWHRALSSHCMENFILTYIQPAEFALRSHKDILVIDLGSCSVRAGILADNPTLPQLFFPAICATDIETGKKVFGIEALSPDIRRRSNISFPLSPQNSKFSIDMDSFEVLLEKIFRELDIDPVHFQIQLCVPRKFSMQTQIAIAKLMFNRFKVDGVNMTHQSVAALYSYNATSGIVVDIGNRLDILPIIDGYIVESGVTRTPYGGQRLLHHLKQAISHKNYSFESEAESYLVRYALEQLGFVAQDFKEEMKRFQMDPDILEKSVTINEFDSTVDDSELSLDSGRFNVTEGLFDPGMWGLDLKGLHKLVHKAIMECSMDVRKEMTKSIYLCGGVTLIPGLADRLQTEVDKLTPPSLTPKVHCSPYRYHASYIGACIIASNDLFSQVMLSAAEWKQSGNTCLSKWQS